MDQEARRSYAKSTERKIFQPVPWPFRYPFFNRKIRLLKPSQIWQNLVTPIYPKFASALVRHQLEALFDMMVFSCDCGLVKPDSEIYDHALQRLGSSPKETIMVDDSFQSDVSGPASLGILGIHLVRFGGLSKADCVVSSLDGILEKIKS